MNLFSDQIHDLLIFLIQNSLVNPTKLLAKGRPIKTAYNHDLDTYRPCSIVYPIKPYSVIYKIYPVRPCFVIYPSSLILSSARVQSCFDFRLQLPLQSSTSSIRVQSSNQAVCRLPLALPIPSSSAVLSSLLTLSSISSTPCRHQTRRFEGGTHRISGKKNILLCTSQLQCLWIGPQLGFPKGCKNNLRGFYQPCVPAGPRFARPKVKVPAIPRTRGGSGYN